MSKKIKSGRPGAFRVSGDGVHNMMPYLMKERNGAAILFEMDAKGEKMDRFLKDSKKSGNHLSLFVVVLAAAVKTLYERPEMNRFIIGRRLYQRENVMISFLVKRTMTDEGENINIKVTFTPEDTPEKIVERIIDAVQAAQSGEQSNDETIDKVMKLPRFILTKFFRLLNWLDFYGKFPKSFAEFDPMRASIFFSNLGSIGVDSCFHHLYDWGTCSIFVTVGRIQRKPVCLLDGSVTAQKMISLRFTMDERITDGYYIAKSVNIFKRYIENPELLFTGKQKSDAPVSVAAGDR